MKRMYLLSAAALLVVVGLSGFSHERPEPVREAAVAAAPAAWDVDKAHSRVGFKVKHLGISNVEGRFHDYDVTLSFDPDDLSSLYATTVVDVASIDTENERRDNHLRSADFFEAETYPEMKFVSKEVRNVDGSTFELVGDLTIKGTTKEVVLDGELLGTAVVRGQERAAFEAQTTINRKDFGLEWDKLTEAGGFVVGHDVVVQLDLELVRQEA